MNYLLEVFLFPNIEKINFVLNTPNFNDFNQKEKLTIIQNSLFGETNLRKHLFHREKVDLTSNSDIVCGKHKL